MNNDNKGKIASLDDNTESRNIIEDGVQRKKNTQNLINGVLALAAVAIVGALSLFYILPSSSEEEQAQQVKQDEALITKQSSDESLADIMANIKEKQEQDRLRREREEQERLRREQEERDRLARETQQKQEVQTAVSQTIIQQPTEPKETGISPAERKLGGVGLLNLASKGKDSENANGISDRLAGGTYANGSIRQLQNRELLLIHGTQIPCVLQTRLVTDNPSILICQVTKPIYSADGSTLLIERGSKVFGEQKTAIITGQNMAFINWSEIDTPNGIRIRIDSLGTDSLGASGINVWVDEKWGKRFGGAILLSFIQDALATGSQIVSRNGNNNVVYDNSERNTGRMAEIALENSINIQPTGYANQGQMINILVARDVDFSDVYRVK
ncbi:type IV secretion system protein VirB10 [Bisgaard Taxon 10/6]|uniref:type IV secretion system protein VirB10 n=1 Tax=Exercitatus varius TaxID=67857 RepID=UPI00294AEB4F|nr:type IV secretion system protein VirB10 [Exercitatus varius]MDG2957051.1 type IV secretion system protein VirB10 [Exercitatus varius]MDG2965261.1 type IV secretion system protein VirB10 [Exercitatus varius]